MTGLRVCALASVCLALLVAVACEPWDPEPRMQTFALVNAHQDVACEGCHPYEPPFTAEVGTCGGLGFVPPADPLAGCLACHECDRPDEAGEAISIPHYVGRSCGDAGCHALISPLWAPDGGTVTGNSCDLGCHLIPPVVATRADAAPNDASHTGHLDGTSLRNTALVCDDCHPAGSDAAPTHDDDVVDVVMESPLARFDGALPAYTAGTCAELYCHGATMTYPPAAPPVWNDAAFDALACDECHGWPPEAHFTSNCDVCHGLTVAGDLPALADKTPHIDGCVQADDDETPSGAPCP